MLFVVGLTVIGIAADISNGLKSAQNDTLIPLQAWQRIHLFYLYIKLIDSGGCAKRMRNHKMVLELSNMGVGNALTMNIEHHLAVLVYETD